MSNTKHISIVYLWAEVTGYVTSTLKQLRNHISGSIDVIHWDKRTINSTQYNLLKLDGIDFHHRSSFNDIEIYNLLVLKSPQIIVVSGWMDRGYIKACRKYKKINKSVKIVAGIDDQLIGSARQLIGKLYFRLMYRSIFDFFWVTGKPQFSYAQFFGYKLDSIISDLYSADTDIFSCCSNFQKRFIFVGRFVKEKSLDILIEAYCCLTEELQREWPLFLIGDGVLKEEIKKKKNSNIIILPFLQPSELNKELQNGGVACLPSNLEPWGVVIHEYALQGLPMLLSSGCGAATEFLIPGYNGFNFKAGDMNSLLSTMMKFINLDHNELVRMGLNSLELSKRVTPEYSALSLLSIINR